MQGGFGITPAYAGKRWPASAAMVTRWDHPRVCGEESLIPALPLHVVGSPPRMRGKDVKQAVKLMMARITPAYAGKRPRTPLAGSSSRDHPRVCGEKTNVTKNPFSATGSPPRMRGKVYQDVRGRLDEGITPAYAGKSLRAFLNYSFFWDHPRVCGEKSSCFFELLFLLGSPPRMRGKAIFLRTSLAQFRITPAYAGKS